MLCYRGSSAEKDSRLSKKSHGLGTDSVDDEAINQSIEEVGRYLGSSAQTPGLEGCHHSRGLAAWYWGAQASANLEGGCLIFRVEGAGAGHLCLK